MNKEKRGLGRMPIWIWRVVGYVAVLGGWQVASGRLLDERLLPGPLQVVRAVPAVWASGTMPAAFQATLTRMSIGFGLSFLIGTAIGLTCQSRWWASFFKDGILIGLVAPALIWALITALVFGDRPFGPIIAVILAAFAPVAVNVAEGVQALPKELLDMGRSFRMARLTRTRHIVIPHLAPYLFTGLRFGFSIAWKVTVLTEIFASSRGIGFEMRVTSQLFRMDEFLVWILAFFFLALFLEKVVLQAIERRYYHWRQGVTAS